MVNVDILIVNEPNKKIEKNKSQQWIADSNRDAATTIQNRQVNITAKKIIEGGAVVAGDLNGKSPEWGSSFEVVQ